MICKTSVNNGREWLDKTVKTQLLSILWSVWPQPYLLTRTNCSSHPLMVMVTLMVMQVIQPSSFFYLSTQSSWRNWFSVISPWLLCDVINVNCHNVDMIILSAVPAHHRLPSCPVSPAIPVRTHHTVTNQGSIPDTFSSQIISATIMLLLLSPRSGRLHRNLHCETICKKWNIVSFSLQLSGLSVLSQLMIQN